MKELCVGDVRPAIVCPPWEQKKHSLEWKDEEFESDIKRNALVPKVN